MTRFRIGLSGCGGGLESISSRELLSLAEWAEQLGFEGLWLNEEHFQGSMIEIEGRRCLSPLILASAIIARTTRLRVGFSVLLLGLHHPLRLAEDLATLDVLSEGRVDFGVSRGANPRYHAAFGSTQAASDTSFEASLETMISAWRPGTISLADGMPPVSIEPKPVQQPHPPIYVGTYTDETVDWTARRGLSLIIHGINNLTNTRRLLRRFTDAGGDPANVPFGRFVYVSDSDANAKRELWPTVLKLTERLRMVALRGHILSAEDLEPEKFYSEMVIAGSPSTCAEKIGALRQEFGIGYLNALSAFFGFLPLPELKRSLHLLGTVVRPQLQR